MAEKSILATSMESSRQRPVKLTEEKHRRNKPNVFNITSATLSKSDTDETSPICPRCKSNHQQWLKNCM
jgi:hypothetical protein